MVKAVVLERNERRKEICNERGLNDGDDDGGKAGEQGRSGEGRCMDGASGAHAGPPPAPANTTRSTMHIAIAAIANHARH